MLPAAHRLRRTVEFSATVRSGVRRGGRRLVVHHLPGNGDEPAQVGFVAGRAVGGSVVRHRVSRRLRAQMAARLQLLPAGSQTVVRALPAAAQASSAELAADLDRALRSVLTTAVAR